jgi:hypothetical protein
MERKDLDRYKRVLLEKRGEMSVTSAEPESPIPAAGGQQGDPVDQANADAAADLQIYLHQADLRLHRAIEEALARIRQSGMERLAPARPAESQFPVPAWELCLGLATVAIAKSANMQFKIRDRRPMLRLSSMSDRAS